MNDKVFNALVLLVISEYAPLKVAWEAESLLVNALNKLNESDEQEYKRQVERLDNFNYHSMYKLTKKHFQKNEAN